MVSMTPGQSLRRGVRVSAKSSPVSAATSSWPWSRKSERAPMSKKLLFAWRIASATLGVLAGAVILGYLGLACRLSGCGGWIWTSDLWVMSPT